MEYFSEMLEKLTSGLVEIFGDSCRKIILYGSAARGDFTEESDIDVAVILPSYTREMADRMWEFIVDLELEYNRVLSVLLIDAEKFGKWENVMPFYQNLKKDGIILWKAA